MASRSALQTLIRATATRTRLVQTRYILPSFPIRDSFSHQKRSMSMSLSVVATENAPSAVGPYSQAIKAGQFIFVSGCVALNPQTMKLVDGGIKEQATQALANMKAVVEASGSSINQIAKCTVFLQDMSDFGDANGVYGEFFGDHRPARSCVEVAKLPLGALFEIECIALAP